MKTLIGKITSAKSTQTVSVLIERLWQHPLYQKRIRRSKKILAHTDQKLEEGQTVKIAEGRNISKNKSWQVIEVLKK